MEGELLIAATAQALPSSPAEAIHAPHLSSLRPHMQMRSVPAQLCTPLYNGAAEIMTAAQHQMDPLPSGAPPAKSQIAGH